MTTADWLPCVGGPLAGREFLPGDDVPEGGEVTITTPGDRHYETRRPQRGYYVRDGGRLVWEEE